MQEDLSALPTVTIAPAVLASVVLFENSFQTSASQTITLTNGGSSVVNFNVRRTWLSMPGPVGPCALDQASHIA